MENKKTNALRDLINQKEKENSNVLLHIIWILFAVAGLIVLGYFLWQISSEYTISPFNNNNVDLGATGQVGDFIGGLVGALWAFSGIILFFLALKLQRDELNLTRDVLIDSAQTQKDTQAVMEEQLRSLKYNSNLETLNYLINDHTKTIARINSKGLINQIEEQERTRLENEILAARKKLLTMAKTIIDENK